MIDDHVQAWAADADIRPVRGYPYSAMVHMGEERILLEAKPHCDDPYTHTRRTKTDEVTIDWSVWVALERAPRPVRLAVAHDRGIWMHTSDDVRRLTPGDRLGGRGGQTRLAWFQWNDFVQVWPPPPDEEAEPRAPEQPNILDLFDPEGDE